MTISASKAAYNYAEFEMTLVGTPKKLADGGYAVLANVTGKADESIVSNVRMIFVPGTAAAASNSSAKNWATATSCM